jgi:hypothetical protein
LNIREGLTHLLLVTKEGEVTRLEHVQSSALAAVSAINDQIGLSPGELFLLTRLVLFVEGEHDLVILQEWFGPELTEAAVRIIPLRGIDNLSGLAESGLVKALNIPVAVLADQTEVRAAREGLAKTRGERAVAKFLYHARRNGLKVEAIGLSRLDILDYLDVEVCQRRAPAFPGWQKARAAARAAREQDWKKWISRQYRLRLDSATIGKLAGSCRLENKIPREIKGKLKEILALAAQ